MLTTPGPDPGLHRRADAVPVHHQLRRHGELHAEPDDVPRRHLRVHPQRAGRRQRERHPGERVVATGSNGLPASRCSTRTPASSTRASYAYEVLRGHRAAVLGRHADEPAAASSLGQPHRRRAAEPALSRLAEHQPDAGRRDQLDEGRGRHTIKAGFYNNHSFKAQNTGVHRFQGTVELRQRHQQPARHAASAIANAALGVFTHYPAGSKFVEGSMIYNNTEFYIQDNWKVNSRLTLDYGIRFTHQQPQHDQFQQMSNFFPDQWSLEQAPVLYVAGCSNGATVCSGNTRNAMDPRTGQILTAAGAANTPAAIGTPIPNVGNPLNGIRQAGDGIAKYGYTWPTLVVGPRFGVAYDLTGDQTLRSSAAAAACSTTVRTATPCSRSRQPADRDVAGPAQRQLADARPRPGSAARVPAMTIFQYDAEVPASWQWQGACRWRCRGRRRRRLLRRQPRLQPPRRASRTATLGQPERGRLRRAYLPQNQDPTLGPSTVPGAERLRRQPAARLPRPGQHQPEHDGVLGRRTTRSRRRSSAASGTASRSARTTRWPLADGQHRPAEAPAARRRTARSPSAPIRRSTRS